MNDTTPKIPEFIEMKAGTRTVRVHPEYADSVGHALLEGKTAVESEHTGRGALQRLDTDAGPVLIRRYRRGGAIRRLIRDRYLLADRPHKELFAHLAAWTRGVPTPTPIAALSEWRGPWCSGAYATGEIAAPDLLSFLSQSPRIAESGRAGSELAACGRAIRAMHEAGVWHADLQVKNLLVSSDRAWIIDFDRARVRRDLDLAARQNNLQRLRRSFMKLGLDMAAFETIVRAYEAST